MGFNVKSLYKENNESSTTPKSSGFNVQSLRDQKFELKTDNDTLIGNISYGAKRAIEGNALDSYTPADDEERKVLDKYVEYQGLSSSFEQLKKDIEENTPRSASFWDNTVNSFKKGWIQSLYGQEAYKAMTGQKNNKDYYKQMLDSEDYSFVPDNWFEKAISGASELLGQQVKQWTDPRSIAAGTAAAGTVAIAGQAGPQIAAPEEIVTVPGAFLTGMAAGSATANFEIEAGNAYEEMIENGISPSLASKIALGVGGANAALEMVQADDLIKSFKILNKTNATKPVAKKILSYMKDRGINIATETAQEVGQEASTIIGVQAANKIEKGKFAYDASEVARRLGETAASSALSFGLLGTGGDVVKTGVNRMLDTAVETAAKRKAKIVAESSTQENTPKTGQTTQGKPQETQPLTTNNLDEVVETAKESKSPDVVKAAERVETALENNETPSTADVAKVVDEVAQQVKNEAPAPIETPTNTETVATNDVPASEVVVGDKFKAKSNGNVLTILSRDENNPVVQIDTGKKQEQRTYTNAQADTLLTNAQFEQIEKAPVSSSDIVEDNTPDAVAVGDAYIDPITKTVYKVIEKNGSDYKVEMTFTNGEKTIVNPDVAFFKRMLTDDKMEKLSADSEVLASKDIATPQIDADKVLSDTNGTLRVDENGVIRFNQKEIDYTNNSLRNGSFKVIIGAKFNKNETKTGRIVGKYGVNKNKDGKYSVVLLSSGMTTFSFDDKQEAEQFAVYVNENIPFNDVKYKTVNGSYYMNTTDEFKAYTDDLKRIHNSKEYVKEIVPAEITDGKVPFTNKADCIDYLKSHIGKAVKVTFGNGMSEERTVESVSTKSLKTKKPDGSISTLDLKGLSFKDTGFFADFGNGNTVDYDFVNVTETPASVTESPESVTKTPESVTETPESVTETPENEKNTPDSVSEETSKSKKNDLFKKLTDSIPLLENDAVVYEATGNEFEVGEKKLSQQVYEYFESLGGVVHRDNFGDVAINDKGVDSSIAHGMGRAKAIAFASVPAVIEKGRQIDFVENWKGRNYDSYVFAAPIRIGTQKAYVGVVVTKSDTDNRYYLHEVSDNEGNIIIIKKDDVSFKSKSEADNDNSSLGETSPTNNIPQEKEIVNTSQAENVEQPAESTPALTDKCELHETTHTKTGEKLWVISLKDKITSDEYKALSGIVKKAGGYYSRFAKTPDGKAIPGFIFKTEPDSDVIKTFNDFFGVAEESTAPDTDMLKKSDDSDIIKEKEVKDGVNDVEQKSEVLAGKSTTDDSGLHPTAQSSTERTAETDSGQYRDNGRELLQDGNGTEPIRPDVGNDSERIHGRNDAESSDAESGKSETEITDSTSEIIDTEAKTVEKPRPSNKGNFVITDDVAAEIDTTAPSAKDNIEAIELLLKIEDEGRPATAEEKKTLAKYKGWGGIDPRRIPYELSSRFGRLFDWEQKKAMQSSMNNAFFTPTKVIDAMYNGLKRMGFRGGNVLETSMGVGNFFGRMPQALSSKSALTGVELESYTARIAQYLYPGATVINKPFQDVAIKNGSYDLVIGNVPFGTNKLTYNKKKYNLHNYFILSSIDKVRDGGVVAVITSAGTLDSYTLDARKAIMDKADVIGCYKLPAGVFSRNADTDVQTDLLILRKRANGEKPSGDSILNVVTTKDGLRVNEYFEKHPENVLGVLSKGTNAWGEITTVLDDGSFYDKLETAMKKLPKDLISGKTELKPIETIVSVSDKPRFFEKNGKIYSDDGAGTATQVTNREQTVRDYMAVRDAYKELLNAYELDKSEEDIKPLRDALSKAYDKFYKAHTAITGDGKKKIGNTKCKNNTFLEADADYYLVSGLEYYNAKDGKFEKSALFEKDTLRKKRVTSVDAASDALAVSLNESGHIDFERMKELTGKTETQLAEELKGEIVLTPEGEYVLTDIYLSGNIYEKLEAVKGKPEFKEQQAMLEAVLPTPKDASSITVKLGANYIEPSYIQDFVADIFKTRIEVSKDNSGRWSIEGVRQTRYGDILNVKYGCKAFNAIQLLEKILNDSEITATKRISDGTKQITVADPEQTDIARQKAEDIKAEFESWIFSDSDRRADIVDRYNRTYNNYRPLDYEHIAEKLSFDSMDSTLKAKLYPHQKKGIARFLFGGNILFAHGVGTGKTFEMIASVMEAKRMGLINKAAMVVPNNKVVDFKRDIAQAYPNAKVLVIDTANKKRQTMLGLVNSNDWDIVLIARTTFTKIPVSNELQANYANQQLEDLEYQISLAQNDRDVSRRQLKGLITQRDNLEQKLKDLNSDTVRDENSVEFEKLGIDCICVDEAHNYKSILTPTKLDIKGLVNRNNAQMANDMLMKLDYMRSIDGKIIFGTGTPITNTVSEIYNMMRMVRPDILEDAGIHSLDEWVNTFAKIETNTEIGIDNKIKTKSTQIIRSFINVSEMIGMFRQFADIVFTDDVVKNLPKAIYKDVKLGGTAEHRQIEEEISSIIAKTPKAELLRTYGQVMAMADAAAVDLRMLSGAESEHNIFKDYSLDELDYADSKINTMCGLVFDEYKASKDIKGTQIIFCDKGSGSGTVYSFNLHKDIMKKLIEKGIPKDEIVIVKDQSDAQLEALYEKVNSGEVRVLIGTSQKMAEGLNVQKRVVAIYHPTVTYKPSDWEQGNARGIRAGNINPEVRIYRFLQENTFDSHKWQAVDRKGEMIRRALRGEQVAEMEDIGADEDSGAGVDAATAMAITSGNPLVKEKIDIDKEVIRLKTLERNYKSEMYRYQDAIAKNPGIISRLTTYLDRLAQDIALRDKYGEKAEMIIKGKKFDKQGEANKALGEAVKSAPKNGNFTKLGEYNGFDIMFKGDTGGIGYTLVLKGANEYNVEYAGGSGNNIARIAGVLNRLTAEQTKQQARLEQLQKDLEFAKTEVNKPFEKEAELSAALEKQKDITYRYEHYSEQKQSEPTETDTASDDEVLSSRDLNLSEDTVLENRWATERVEDNKVKGVNIADIVRSISEKFGIPIATGKVTDREASGIYKAKPETIRTRIANNLPTISHELGHHLCKKYGLDGLESVAILRNSVSQEYLDMYDDDVTKNKESVAEFIRSYLKNTNEAVRLCPEFYAEFIQALSKEDLKAVNEIASAVNEYLSYNISERYDAAITSSQKKEKVPFREKWEKFYTNWVDSFHPQKEAVDYVQDATGRTLSGKGNAYVLATNSLNAHAVANYLVCEGFRNLSGDLIDAKSFIDCIGMVDSKDVKLLDRYLVLRHSLEWIAPEQDDVTAKRVFADDTLENVDEIKKQIAEIEDTHPEIKTAAENLYEYQNNVLKHFVIPAGGMTRETLETLNRKYPSYVPFYRAVGNKRSGMAKGTFANQRSPIMRAKGSGAMIISPTESIIRNTEKMVKFALRNQVMRIWANYADNVDGFGQFMEKVSPDMIPHFTDISKQKESFTEALQHQLNAEDYFAVSDMFDEIFGDAVTDSTPIANANKKIVTVLQGGTPSYYQIHDNAFYTSVAELSPQQTSGLLKVMNSVMQPMKLLITQNNPIFAVTNAIRDYGTAYKLSEVNNPVTFAAQYVKALATIIANGESYKQYKAMGGGHSSELSANIENIKSTLRKVSQKDMGKARRLAYSIFRHPVETVASFNDLIESVPRFAEFQRTLANGGDLQEAIFNASDLTTNFKRSGSGDTAKTVNKVIMFNNAAIQGLDKTFRTITNKDIKKRYKTLLKWLLNALIMGILGYLYNREVDEEGYKNLSAYKKNNFYNYALGDGKFISLPKPRENALLDTITERTLEYLLSENEEAFYDFGTYLGQQLLPPMLPDTLDPVNAAHSVLGSTILGGIVDVGFNQDFKGTPIEGMYDKYTPSNERYTDSTTKIAYALGQTKLARDIDMSPKKIDHLISSYTGILGQVNKALFPMNPERKDTSIGLRNKFVSDSNYSTDVLNRMYENEEKAEKAFQYAGTIDTAVEYEQNAIITSYISGMNKAVKALPESEQRNGRAYLLKALNRWNYDNTASQTNMLSRLDGEKVSDDVIITSLPESTMEWTVYETNSNGKRIKRSDGSYLRTKCEYQMTPQEYDAYIKDYLNLVEKYRTWQGNNISNTADYTAALEETSTEVKKVLNKKYQQKYYGKAQKSVKD